MDALYFREYTFRFSSSIIMLLSGCHLWKYDSSILGALLSLNFVKDFFAFIEMIDISAPESICVQLIGLHM